MGKPIGFMEYGRLENPFRPEEVRLKDYCDLHEPLPEEARHQQASRCVDCGVPFCQSDFGCPLHNLIPEWNELLYLGFEREALKRLLITAPFPEFTGHVCPALCEKACNLADDGVTNKDNELYLIETAFSKGWIQPRVPVVRNSRKIAVIGSGPSGLAAADLLNQMGYEVTVFERMDRPGGLLMYGIPNMKLPKEIVIRRIRLLEEEGVRFRLREEAGEELAKEYDAVLFCGGARKPRSLNLEHMDSSCILYAVDYLTEATRSLLDWDSCRFSASGKNVVVVGGGDTGNDCVGTALRQHCASVIQLEMMPEPPEARLKNNPWPEWPRILRTDYGQMEAINRQGADPRIYETTVKEIRVNDGYISGLVTIRLRRTPKGGFEQVSGSEKEVPCDLLLIAAGFTGCDDSIPNAFRVQTDSKGRLFPEDGSHHLTGNLFSAGDMRNGQSLVVRALADGRAAAKEIDQWLEMKQTMKNEE